MLPTACHRRLSDCWGFRSTVIIIVIIIIINIGSLPCNKNCIEVIVVVIWHHMGELNCI